MKTLSKLLAGLAITVPICFAGATRTWVQTDYSDFEKGNLHNLSLRSDGRVTLAPKSVERFDSSSAYLWALARDSKGNLYTGGGPGAKLFRATAAGGQKIADFDALEVHAIAIDSKDNVFVGTSPDGKVYKVSAGGKSEQFYDPKQKYIWAMAFDRTDNLYIATGDAGEIHRVSPNGKGAVFFKSDETHIRSMIFDRQGNLIAGTDPGGLIIRVDARAEGFVLYEMGKKEITALAVAPDGSIYAAGVGGKQSSSPVSTPSLPVLTPTSAISVTVAAAPLRPSPSEPTLPAPSSLPRSAPASGSTDVYCIHPGGYPEKMWSGNQDVVYAIAFDAQNRVLLGSGNKGVLYRIDTSSLYTALLRVSSNQITALQSAPDGSLYAATGNVGKIYQFGPALESKGILESDVFDAGGFALWGRAAAQGELNGGSLTIETRSGNLDRPHNNWSAWSAPIVEPRAKSNAEPRGGRIASPPARFLQWRATLTLAAAGSSSPNLDSVEAAYLPRNVAPHIEEIEITAANYHFAPSAVTLTPSSTPSISLPAIGKRPLVSISSDTTPSTMQFAKGWTGARWSASDENGDILAYDIEIRGVKESDWKPLKQKTPHRYFSFDSTAFPDGEYRLRITATDAPGNTPAEALETRKESNVFLIDNTPPRITDLRNEGASLHWRAADALSVIKNAEYSIDGGEWTMVDPVTKLSDSLALDYNFAMPALAAGEHTIAVRVMDDYDNASVEKIVIRRK
ncbi:MAG: hypothetical protein M3Z23_13435 [Acidobacteriota bacterium]|nr:hypothetical protein [Acidobacteriota bacterium]